MNLIDKALIQIRLLAVAIVCTACAATPPEMEGMFDAPGHVVFTLLEGMQIRSEGPSVHLAKGNYRVVKQNAHGSMIAAPAFGVIRSSSRGYLGFQGGVWIPRDRNANAKVYVLYETSERLYPNLDSALSLPADAERKMLEVEREVGASTDPAGAGPSDMSRVFQHGNPAHSPALMMVMALAETQRGKPDVIAEMPQADFEKRLEPSTRSSNL